MDGNDFREVRPRQDDEKTIHEESANNAWTDNKTSEDVERSEITGVTQSEEHAGQIDPADDYPDGGLKAWLCVVGVS